MIEQHYPTIFNFTIKNYHWKVLHERIFWMRLWYFAVRIALHMLNLKTVTIGFINPKAMPVLKGPVHISIGFPPHVACDESWVTLPQHIHRLVPNSASLTRLFILVTSVWVNYSEIPRSAHVLGWINSDLTHSVTKLSTLQRPHIDGWDNYLRPFLKQLEP